MASASSTQAFCTRVTDLNAHEVEFNEANSEVDRQSDHWLLDAIAGDATLLIRRDEIEAS